MEQRKGGTGSEKLPFSRQAKSTLVRRASTPHASWQQLTMAVLSLALACDVDARPRFISSFEGLNVTTRSDGQAAIVERTGFLGTARGMA